MSPRHAFIPREIGSIVIGGLGLSLAASPRVAQAVDPFEIQVYDATANAPGTPGLELHLNTVPSGTRDAPPPELPAHHQSHFTLEPSLGVRPWWELGGYFQMALTGDGSFRYAGVKLRSKFVTVPSFHREWRLGLNFELSRVPEAFEPDRWGGEVRPMAVWENEHWLLAVNPIVEVSLAGAGAKAGPSFAPALMAKFKIRDAVALGVEYYADLGPIAAPVPLKRQEQYLFEAIDLLSIPHFELNAGVGEGLTDASNGLIVKVILGYAWESVRLWGRGAPVSSMHRTLRGASGRTARAIE